MDDFAWLTDHSQEIHEKYAGKWIAVSNGRIVGIGDTAVEAAKRADEECHEGDYILEKVEHDLDVIYACFRMAHRTHAALWPAAGAFRVRRDQDHG